MQRKEQRGRAARFASVEERKAERRRAWEGHLAAKGNGSLKKGPFEIGSHDELR